jgi:hypothetical protein
MTGNWFWVFNRPKNWDSRNQDDYRPSRENAAYVRLIGTANEKLHSQAWCVESSQPGSVKALYGTRLSNKMGRPLIVHQLIWTAVSQSSPGQARGRSPLRPPGSAFQPHFLLSPESPSAGRFGREIG